ncbi:hypothetical protein GCM10022225_19440 [Plantactinospora mayteni]|uniref:Uncharacterized protein n=1 Tax=Plantactinospora mayteni TaxID=566021 RepID=A0ABQ4EN74_9ACTN|nr:hypothetical protein [Plantactinospora mayteni]GIG96127.1 hypothetical protein Pma05_27000 [Plantactinospora mayteni]
MSDFDDKLLTGAFAEFRNEAMPRVKPVGVAAAYATVRGRRRTRTITTVVLAVLFVVGPVTAYAAVGHDSQRPPPSEVADTPTPQPEPTTPPATMPSSATATATTPPAAPDGRISQAELGRTTLEIPAWPSDAIVSGCVSGSVRFSNGEYRIRDSVAMNFDKVVHTDLDRDGARETVARLSCGDQGSSTFQVLAFDRDAAGKIRTLGRVVAQTGPIKGICDVRAGSASTVQVRVVDYPTPHRCLEPLLMPAYAQEQWRTYAWDGDRFTQTGEPTAFPPNNGVSDLTVTSSDLTFGAPDGGVRRGTMTVTVRSLGPGMVPYEVRLNLPRGLTLLRPDGCEVENHPTGSMAVSCDYPALNRNGSRTFTFEFTVPKAVEFDIVPRAGVWPDGWGDPEQDNNYTEFSITF